MLTASRCASSEDGARRQRPSRIFSLSALIGEELPKQGIELGVEATRGESLVDPAIPCLPHRCPFLTIHQEQANVRGELFRAGDTDRMQQARDAVDYDFRRPAGVSAEYRQFERHGLDRDASEVFARPLR